MLSRRITDRVIAETPPAKDKPIIIADDLIPGFRLKINRTRRLLFHAGEFRTPDGKRRVLYKALPLDSAERARELAHAHHMQLERLRNGKSAAPGRIPSALEAWQGGAALEPSLSFRQHLQDRKAAERTIAFYEDVMRLHLARFHHVPLSDVQRLDVVAEHRRISRASGPYAANAMLRLGSAIHNYCSNVLDLEVAKNVFRLAGIANVEKPKQSGIAEADLAAWFDKVAKLSPVTREIFWCGLFTGLRRESLLNLQWDDVKADHIEIRVAKGGKAARIPLTDAVRGSFSRLKQAIPLTRRFGNMLRYGQWVFPSEASASGHATDPRAPGLPSLHSLRHTFRAMCAGAGVAEIHSRLLMLHSLRGIHNQYATASAMHAQLLEAAEKVAAYIRAHLPADAEQRLTIAPIAVTKGELDAAIHDLSERAAKGQLVEPLNKWIAEQG